MTRYRVLLTDYAWPDVELEREVLAEIDADLIVAPQQDVDSLAALAVDVDAIMTCWANVPEEVLAAARKCRIVSRMGIGLDNIDVVFIDQVIIVPVPDQQFVHVHHLPPGNASFHRHLHFGNQYCIRSRPFQREKSNKMGK